MNARNGETRRTLRCWVSLTLITVFCPHGGLAAEQRHGMLLIAPCEITVGTSEAERERLGQRFDCHTTWLNDDLPWHQAALSGFWMDRYPVTNAQYLAFIEAGGYSKPAWWGRWGGVFPAEYAEHPVVGVSGKDAAAYAEWAGKRLPTAEEWEATVGNPEGGVFAWGDAWPGPLKLNRQEQVHWELPGTRPVGLGTCGHGTSGVEDFAGQVLEWVADAVPHHGVQFQLMKGASWFHQDPVNFRTAAGWYAYEGWRSAMSGFRCALDGTKEPPPVLESKPRNAVSVESAKEQLEAPRETGPPILAAAGGNSRHISIRIPKFGPEQVGLSAPETIIWNGTGVMTWQKTPDMTWTVRMPQRSTYEMRFDQLRMAAEFLAQDDFVEQRFTAINPTDQKGDFRTSSCLHLQGHPMFYDCEQLRTYVLDSHYEFTPIRRLSRSGDCVRWITGPNANELGENVRWAVLAVVSRDCRQVIATGRAGEGSGFSVATNALFTCLHTDSTVPVPPQGQATTRQLFWFFDGSLRDLRERILADLDMVTKTR